MKILRAEHLGMCFGVRDAIALALKQSRQEPVTVLGDLVHNETVLLELRARGIKIAQQVDAVETRTAMVTAQIAAPKNGWRIQSDVPISAPRKSSARKVRVMSRRISAMASQPPSVNRV